MTLRWRALGAVIRDASPVWVLLAGVVAAGLVGWLFAAGTSTAVRWAGMILQLLGLAAVAYGLRQTRKLFDAPTVLGQAWGWFGRLRRAFRRPEPITLEAAAGGVAFVGGKVRLRRGAGAGATVEQRLDVLEANLKSFKEEFDQTTSELSNKTGWLEKELNRERDERKAADNKTWKQIEEVSIGGLHLEVVGLTWLALGVVATSIPDELARVVSPWTMRAP
jgi:hypothetical protein